MAVLDPPISTDPSVRLTVPAGVTTAIHEAGPVLFLQKPIATPLPLNFPSFCSSGSL